MSDKKKSTAKEPNKRHRHANPVIHVEADEGSRGPMVELDDEHAFHPARHHVGTAIGEVPEVPNLSPGGSVTIKR
jgi:hypothetical protein